MVSARGMASEIFGWGEPSNPSCSAYDFYLLLTAWPDEVVTGRIMIVCDDWNYWPAFMDFQTYVVMIIFGRFPCSILSPCRFDLARFLIH